MSRNINVAIVISLLLLGLMLPDSARAVVGTQIKLTRNGVAQFSIVRGPSYDTDSIIKAAVDDFKTYLEKISRATFTLTTGDGRTGIAVGTAADFPLLKQTTKFNAANPNHAEKYGIYSHTGGVQLIGANPLGVQHAVWDFFERLGYRQYFPTAKWEIVPNIPTVTIRLNVTDNPDFRQRAVGYVTMDEEGASSFDNYFTWIKRNRFADSINIASGHSYATIKDWIMLNHKQEYEANAVNWFPATGNKFCVTEPGLQEMVLAYAKAEFAADPRKESISLSPSDGAGWEAPCANEEHTEYELPSQRALILANYVANGLAADPLYSTKTVGLQAYGYTSEPPNPDHTTLRVAPNIVIAVTSAYMQGDLSVGDVMEKWRNLGATRFSVYEYYAVIVWDEDRPGMARVTRLDRLADTIAEYKDLGLIASTGEASDSFAPHGLGYWILSKLLWNPYLVRNNPAVLETLKNDFFTKSFGPAAQIMREFYDITDGFPRAPYLTPDLLGSLYRKIESARAVTAAGSIERDRVNDFATYVRYLELLRQYDETTPPSPESVTPDDEPPYTDGCDPKVSSCSLSACDPGIRNCRLDAFEKMMMFSFRARSLEMFSYKGLFQQFKDDIAQLQNRYDLEKFTEFYPGNHPGFWDGSPITDAEIQSFVAAGTAANPLKSHTDTVYSTDYVPASPLQLPAGNTGTFKYVTGKQNWYVWVDEALKDEDPASATYNKYVFGLDVSAGLTSLEAPGSTWLDLYKFGQDETPVAHTQVKPNDKDAGESGPRQIEFSVDEPGLYRLYVDDSNDLATINWWKSQALNVTKLASLPEPTGFDQSWTMYFYVPQGTARVGGMAQGGYVFPQKGTPYAGPQLQSRNLQYLENGVWVDANPYFPAGLAHFLIDVPPGKDGQLWRANTEGVLILETVPPLLARNANELLLPAEVVEVEKMVLDLTKVTPSLPLTSSRAGTYTYFLGDKYFYVWVDQSQLSADQKYHVTLAITVGKISGYESSGPARLSLITAAGERTDSAAVEVTLAPPGGQRTPTVVTLTTATPGLHRLLVEDNLDSGVDYGYVLDWWTNQDVALSFYSTSEDPDNFYGSWTMYFYVPKCTATLEAYVSKEGKLQYTEGSLWKDAGNFEELGAHFSVPVPAGKAGTLWRIYTCNGDCHLTNVLSIMARNADDLLLPQGVLTADQGTPACP
jgi:hypothetical protein